MKSFESYRQLVILFWGPICIKNTFYVIACSIPFVLLLFWSVLFEKLDCKHLRGSHLLTFLWISGADLYVTSRWPDTSVFHSLIPALVPRPKFITPSWSISMVSAQLPSNKTKSRPLTVSHSHVSSACFFISCLLRCVHLRADMFIHRLWTSKQRLI